MMSETDGRPPSRSGQHSATPGGFREAAGPPAGRRWRILPLVLPALLLAGCDSPDTLGPGELVTIAIAPSSATLDEGHTLQLGVVGEGRGDSPAPHVGPPSLFTWQTSDRSVATVEDGLVRAQGQGVATITASRLGGSFARAEVSVLRTPEGLQVRRGDQQTATVGLSLAEELEVLVLSGVGHPVTSAGVEFTVAEGGGEVSTRMATTDDDGVARVSWTLGPVAGIQRIDARPSDRPDVILSFTATGTPDLPEGIRVLPEGVALRRGTTLAFQAVVTDRFGNEVGSAPVRWSSDDEEIAIVDALGRVTTLKRGETSILATLEGVGSGPGITQDGGPSANSGRGQGRGRVTVDDEGEGEGTSLSVVSGDGQSGEVGQILDDPLRIQAFDASGAPIRNRKVDWKVSGGGGQVLDVSSKTDGQGRASAQWRLGTTVGAGTLEVTIEGVGGVTLTSTASAGPLAVVKLSPSSASIEIAEEQRFEWSATDAFGNPVQPSTEPEWRVRDQDIAVISAPGRARGRSSGTTLVIASVAGVEGEAELAVVGEGGGSDEEPPEVAAVEVSPASASVPTGGTVDLNVTVLATDGTELVDAEVEWSSSDPGVAEVASTGRVTGVAPGSASIAARAGGVSGIAQILVTSPEGPSDPGHRVPDSIAGDCSRDVTAELLTWIGSVPDHATLSFGSNACYNIDGGLVISDRHGLTFEGNGSTFRVFSRGAPKRANWIFRGGSNITLRSMIAVGANPNAGTGQNAYDSQVEWQHGYAFQGTQGALLDRVEAFDLYGDFVEAEPDPRVSFPGEPVRDMVVRDSRFERNGRMGFGLTHVDGFVLENSYIADVRWNVIDVEPDAESAVVRNIRIQGNRIGDTRFTLLAVHAPPWYKATGPDQNIRNIVFRDNEMLANPQTCWAPIYIEVPEGKQWNTFTIEGNRLRAYGATIFLNRARSTVMRDNSVQYVSGGFCQEGMTGVWVQDSHTGEVTGNTFTGATRAYQADALTTGFTVTNNTP